MTGLRALLSRSRAGRAAQTLALALLATLCAAHAAAEPLAQGIAAYAKGEYRDAARILLPHAQAGNAEAQLRVGMMHYRGLGLREDDSAAFSWFRRAAIQGHAGAQLQLAHMYAFGHGVPQEEHDPDRAAARWYFESAQQGNAEAQYALGILFLSGKGVRMDAAEAAAWIRRAANAGHADAQRFLGVIAEPR